MHCPRCGDWLNIYHEHRGYRWLYRMYPCPHCKVIWERASRTRGENYWKIEECRAWEAVGIPIIEGK